MHHTGAVASAAGEGSGTPTTDALPRRGGVHRRQPASGGRGGQIIDDVEKLGGMATGPHNKSQNRMAPLVTTRMEVGSETGQHRLEPCDRRAGSPGEHQHRDLLATGALEADRQFGLGRQHPAGAGERVSWSTPASRRRQAWRWTPASGPWSRTASHRSPSAAVASIPAGSSLQGSGGPAPMAAAPKPVSQQ